jgi:uncharacterized protein YodC (DUF2158 family)
MAQFKVGDVVRLKSGGPQMTVKEVRRDGKLACIWFDDKNKHDGGVFVSEMLDPAGQASGASSRVERSSGSGGEGGWMG